MFSDAPLFFRFGAASRAVARYWTDTVVAAALVSAGIALSWWRLRYAVDINEEALHVGIPYAFAVGHRPFLDERLIFQGMGLPLLPFFRFFLWWNGGSDGIILFARELHLLYRLVAAFFVFRLARHFVPRSIAWLLAGCTITYVPWSSPVLGYNVQVQLGTLTAGALGGLGLLSDRPGKPLFAAYLLYAAVSVAHPALLPAAGISALVLFFLNARREARVSREAARAAGAALLVVAIGITLLLAYAGPRTIFDDFASHLDLVRRGKSGQGGGWRKFASIILYLVQDRLYALLVAAVFGLLALCSRLRETPFAKRAEAASAALIPLLLFAALARYPTHGAFPLVFLLPVFALPYIRELVRRGEWERYLAPLAAWGLSCVAAVDQSWASGQSLWNGGVTLQAAALMTLLFAARFHGKTLGTALCVSVMAVQTFSQFSIVCYDEPISRLSATMESGPYRGLRTTPEKKALLESVERDLRALAGTGRSLFVDYAFAPGYLMTTLKPECPWLSVESAKTYGRDMEMDYFRSVEKYPDLVLRMKRFSYGPGVTYDVKDREQDALDRLFAPPLYDTVVVRPDYEIRRRAGKS